MTSGSDSPPPPPAPSWPAPPPGYSPWPPSSEPVPQPPAPVPRRSVLRWVLTGCAVAFALVFLTVVGGCATAVWWVDRLGDDAEPYLEALVDREYDDAFALRCAADRAAQAAEDFRLAQHRRPLASYDTTGGSFGTGETDERRVHATLRYVDGSVEHVTISLRREDGAWRVCGPLLPQDVGPPRDGRAPAPAG